MEIELVSLKYVGGKTHSSEPWNRKKFVFKKENDYICEIPHQLAKELCSDRGAGQYIPVRTVIEKAISFDGTSDVVDLKNKEKNPLLCDKCDFVSKSDYGLLIHKRKHFKKEKIK